METTQKRYWPVIRVTGRFKFIIYAIYHTFIFVALYITVVASISFGHWAKNAAITGWDRALLYANQQTWGGLNVTLEHKKGEVVEVKNMSRIQVEKTLYYALLQLELQGRTLHEISEAIDLEEATGAKVLTK